MMDWEVLISQEFKVSYESRKTSVHLPETFEEYARLKRSTDFLDLLERLSKQPPEIRTMILKYCVDIGANNASPGFFTVMRSFPNLHPLYYEAIGLFYNNWFTLNEETSSNCCNISDKAMKGVRRLAIDCSQSEDYQWKLDKRLKNGNVSILKFTPPGVEVDDLWAVSNGVHYWMPKFFGKKEGAETKITKFYIKLRPYHADLNSDQIDWVINCFEYHFRAYGKLRSVTTDNLDAWFWESPNTWQRKLKWHPCEQEKKRSQENDPREEQAEDVQGEPSALEVEGEKEEESMQEDESAQEMVAEQEETYAKEEESAPVVKSEAEVESPKMDTNLQEEMIPTKITVQQGKKHEEESTPKKASVREESLHKEGVTNEKKSSHEEGKLSQAHEGITTHPVRKGPKKGKTQKKEREQAKIRKTQSDAFLRETFSEKVFFENDTDTLSLPPFSVTLRFKASFLKAYQDSISFLSSTRDHLMEI